MVPSSSGQQLSHVIMYVNKDTRKMTTSNEAMIEANTFDANGNISPKTFSIQPTSARTAWCQWKCHQKTSSIQHFPTRTAWFQLKCHQKYLFYSVDICAPAFTFHMGQWTASICEFLMALSSWQLFDWI